MNIELFKLSNPMCVQAEHIYLGRNVIYPMGTRVYKLNEDTVGYYLTNNQDSFKKVVMSDEYLVTSQENVINKQVGFTVQQLNSHLIGYDVKLDPKSDMKYTVCLKYKNRVFLTDYSELNINASKSCLLLVRRSRKELSASGKIVDYMLEKPIGTPVLIKNQ